MASIVVDISLVRLYDLVSKQLIPLESKQVLFSVISITILTSQFILLEFIKPKKAVEKERIRLPFVNLYIITKAVQYILASLVVLIIITKEFLNWLMKLTVLTHPISKSSRNYTKKQIL